ncbi:hypothetical protein JCM10212_004345 [Sporobolomyces blumeae]
MVEYEDADNDNKESLAFETEHEIDELKSLASKSEDNNEDAQPKPKEMHARKVRKEKGTGAAKTAGKEGGTKGKKKGKKGGLNALTPAAKGKGKVAAGKGDKPSGIQERKPTIDKSKKKVFKPVKLIDLNAYIKTAQGCSLMGTVTLFCSASESLQLLQSLVAKLIVNPHVCMLASNFYPNGKVSHQNRLKTFNWAIWGSRLFDNF